MFLLQETMPWLRHGIIPYLSFDAFESLGGETLPSAIKVSGSAMLVASANASLFFFSTVRITTAWLLEEFAFCGTWQQSVDISTDIVIASKLSACVYLTILVNATVLFFSP